MKTKINVFLSGSPVQGLTQYKQESDESGVSDFSFSIDGNLALEQTGTCPGIIVINRGEDGINDLMKIKKLCPGTQVIFAVSDKDILRGRDALKLGAMAYLILGTRELAQIKRILNICRVSVKKQYYPKNFQSSSFQTLLINALMPIRRFLHSANYLLITTKVKYKS